MGNNIEIKPFQDRFIFSKARYPAFWGGWGVGKSLSLIIRVMLYSQHIPNNLGIVFRKEFTDLRDSTCKDFERYTGIKIDSKREVVLKNGSTILFRHIEELNNIQNINCGFYAIEQADELESSNEFFTLFGRLRRKVTPDETFKSYGLPERSGFVIGNAGNHWGRELWRDGKLEDSECIEASTLDNADVLPKDFLDSLEILKKNKPELYKQFVLNDWSVGQDQYILIPSKDLDRLQGITIHCPKDIKVISIDPSMGGDECVFKAFVNSREIDQVILHERDTMKVAGEAMIFSAKHKIDDFIIDSIGIGKGIADKLSEVGKRVIHHNVAVQAGNAEKFSNLKSEMWWYVMEQVMDSKVEYPPDEETRKQISSVKYKVVNSNGKIQMEAKSETKKRLGYSPDRADAWVQGIWALQYVQPVVLNKRDRYSSDDYEFNPQTC